MTAPRVILVEKTTNTSIRGTSKTPNFRKWLRATIHSAQPILKVVPIVNGSSHRVVALWYLGRSRLLVTVVFGWPKSQMPRHLFLSRL